jgi:L-gulonolactone oxidase
VTSTAGARRGAGRSAWTNWARTERVLPVRRVRPRDAAEAAAAVRAAVRDGLPVKAVGAGHSFTGAAAGHGVLVETDELSGIRSADPATGLVEIAAGTRLHTLSPMLWAHGLALPSLGDIDRQAIAGAVQTGTHGTGLAWGCIASGVRGLELALADGTLARCSPTERPDLFEAARVGVGAFGVLTSVTLQCVPAFGIRATEAPVPLAEFLETAEQLAAQHAHVECFWFPHTDRVLRLTKDHVVAQTRLDPQPRWRALLDDELLPNVGLGMVARVGAALPRRIPALNRTVARLLSERSWSDRSYLVFANARRVRFREMEFGLPIEAWRDAVADLRRWLDRPGHEVGFPVEIRFTGGDDPWLSMSHGRATAYLSIQTYWRQPHEPFFAAAQEIFSAYRGRPHWGKLHDLSAGQLAPLYPHFEDVVRVRDEVDPGRVFANAYTRQVLGD